MGRLMALLICLAMLANVSGCAVGNRHNTPTLNFVEKRLIPGDMPLKELTYPLLLPVGMAAATVDMFLVRPAMVMGDAWDDTRDLLWDRGFDWDTGFMSSSASLFPRLAATPLVAGGALLARSAFDIPPRSASTVRSGGTVAVEEREARRKQQEQLLADARDSLARGELNSALRISNELLALDGTRDEAAVIKATVLLELREMNALAAMPPKRRLFADQRFMGRCIALLGSGTTAERMQLLVMLDSFGAATFPLGSNAHLQQQLIKALERNLAEEDRAIQLQTLLLLEKYRHVSQRARMLLEDASKKNDTVMAIAARRALR